MEKRGSIIKFRRLRPRTQKILLLLLGGVALGLSHPPRQYFRILKSIKKEWEWIDKRNLRRTIQSLYKSRLIDAKDNPDGTTTIVLTQHGKTHALRYEIDTISIPPMNKWDRKWRIVMFDIPEKHKRARDALSQSLKRMGFAQLQKSVFVHPFDCSKEIMFVTEFFNLSRYIRHVLAEHIDIETVLMKKFHLA